VSRSLSPRVLARAIGVSESSLKRWSDDGLLTAARTAGGHRRITLQEAVRFVRAIGATVVRPDLLGLTDLATIGPDWAQRSDINKAMHEALENGHAAEVRAMVQSLYLGGWSPAAIFDGPIRFAMVEVGKLWLHAEWGIVVEHRATDICVQAINQLRFLTPARPATVAVAVGSAAEHDPYMLPSLMAATVVGECGFLDVNLGTITPPAVLINAAKHYQAKLVWVSASAGQDSRKVAADLTRIATELKELGTAVVAGGRAVNEIAPADLPGVVVATSMTEMAAFARGVLAQYRAEHPEEPARSKDQQDSGDDGVDGE
jgi:MerR family transcriptional regulator, light-induced transcriptional regulator